MNRQPWTRWGCSRVRLMSVALVVAVSVVVPADDETPGAWLQWGGPDQAFSAPSEGITTGWPESGPERLWSRELGEGYSAILVEGDRLYTMHRTQNKEAVICRDAATGETVWESG